MLTLDEAIKHCEEKAKELRRKAFDDYENDKTTLAEFVDCRECASEHEQLAEWLTELKAYRECPLLQDECMFCNPNKCHNAKESDK